LKAVKLKQLIAVCSPVKFASLISEEIYKRVNIAHSKKFEREKKGQRYTQKKVKLTTKAPHLNRLRI
jgi:hypothetical protein